MSLSMPDPDGEYCYFVMDLVHPTVKDLFVEGGIEDEETGCKRNAPVFGSRGSEGCRESWAKALLAKSKPIVDRRDSSVKYYENPKLLDRYGRSGVKEINGWINRLHVSRKGIARYGGETEFS